MNNKLIITSLIGITGGILGSLFGFSGAFFIVPLLLLFGICTTQQSAQGTTLCMLLPPISIFAVYTYHKKGYIDFPVALILVLFYLLGTIIGSNVAIKIDEKKLKTLFAFVMSIIALYSIYGAINHKSSYSLTN